MSKIIDFDKRGNVVRFFLGKDDTDIYYGDDWDNVPYEHNAGEVYDEYISGYADIAFPYNYHVLEPRDDWHYSDNSPWRKDDMRERLIPCIVAVPDMEDTWDYNFGEFAASDCKSIKKFYFGDHMEPTSETVVYTE